MSQIPVKTTYDEPTIMWRIKRAENVGAHAVIIPRGAQATALWFTAGQVQETREFPNWAQAIHWVYLELANLLLDGWEVEELEG